MDLKWNTKTPIKSISNEAGTNIVKPRVSNEGLLIPLIIQIDEKHIQIRELLVPVDVLSEAYDLVKEYKK